MNISSITHIYSEAGAANLNSGKNSTEKKTSTKAQAETGVIYESSAEAKKAEQTTADRQAIISQLKEDAEKRSTQLMNLVKDMFTKQGKVFNTANAIWSILASGDFTVDPEIKKQAQEDIAAGGYWGVEQTSDRIFKFAEVLAGGSPESMEKMRNAFQKGYDQAAGTWGRDLPDLCKDTYDAVMDRFAKWSEEHTVAQEL